MTVSDTLNVWYDDQLVGFLWRNSTNQIGFRYNKTWLETPGLAISVLTIFYGLVLAYGLCLPMQMRLEDRTAQAQS